MLKLFLISALLNNTAIPQDTHLDSAFQFAAYENNVSLSLLRAVCWVESNHRITPVKPDGKDFKPSYGVCQLKLATARDRGYKGDVITLHKNNAINIYYAAKHLAHLLQKYEHLEMALTAYNKGGKNIEKRRLNNSYVIKVKLAIQENR